MILLLFRRFLNRLKSERGEIQDPGSGGTANEGGGTGGDAWYSSLPDNLTVEHEGKQVPLKEMPWVKETPDVPTLAKRFHDTNREFGSRIKMPGRDAKPEEINAFKQKVYQAGVFSAPPESPDKYEVKLDAIPEPLRDQESVGSVRAWAHKNGVSQEGMTELMDIYTGMVTKAKPLIEYDRAQSEATIRQFAEKEGLTMNQVMSYGGAWLTKNMSEGGMRKLVASGLANDPELSWMIAKAARDSGEDISMTEGRTDPGVDAEFEACKDISTNPGNALYAQYVKEHNAGGGPLVDRVVTAYKKKFGTGDYQPQGASE